MEATGLTTSGESSRVKTLFKNLTCLLSVQDLEGNWFRRPTLQSQIHGDTWGEDDYNDLPGKNRGKNLTHVGRWFLAMADRRPRIDRLVFRSNRDRINVIRLTAK